MADIRQSIRYAKFLKTKGWRVNRINNVNYFTRKLPVIPYYFIKIQRPQKINYKDINKLSKKYRFVQIVIEPKDTNQELRIRNQKFKVSSPYLPSKTILINLSKPQKQIFNDLKKNTKYCIRKSKSDLVEMKSYKEIKSFRKFYKKAAGWNRYVPSFDDLYNLKNIFKKDCFILMEKSGHSGGLFLKSTDTAYYWFAFNDKVGRSNFAQHKIVWEGIKWAKKRKAKIFDMEGIYDNRFPINKWKGFSYFKMSFGGKTKKYPLALVKTFLRVL